MIKNDRYCEILCEKRNCAMPPSCLDDVLCTLGNTLNREYRLFYSNRWMFEDKTFEKSSDCSETSINSLNKEYYERIFEAQGFSIKMIEENLFWAEAHEIFAKYKYVIAMIDGYELPWDAYYRKNHNSHALIITKMDFEKNISICCDPWHELENVSLKFEQLKRGIHKIYVPIIGKIENIEEKKKLLLNHAIDSIDVNMFQDMRNLANGLSKDSNFDVLFRKINRVAWYRWTFGIYLKSMKNVNIKLYQYGVEMQTISSSWNNVKLLLIKCGILCAGQNGRLNAVIDYVKQVIYDIAEREYYLYMQIIRKEELLSVQDSRLPQILKNGRISSINIQHLYDNKGLCRVGSLAECVDFTGTGEYFIIDTDYDKIVIGNGKENDNIICNGQCIELGQCYINNLIIIGCCEWGNYSDYLALYDNDEMLQKVLISLSDWSEGPKLGERIYASGYVCKHTDKEVNEGNKAYIYQVEIPVANYVKRIVLPKCANMHIMAIQYN